MVHVDAMLNLAWAGVCLATFGWFIGFERGRTSGTRRARTYRAVALSLALVSLFPCVSASDDSARLQFFGSGAAPSGPHNPHPTPASQRPDKQTLGTLVRLLEALDSVQIAVSVILRLILCLFALAIIATYKSVERFLPIRAGRAPPAVVLPSFC